MLGLSRSTYEYSLYCAFEDLYIGLIHSFIDEADALLYRPNSLLKNQESIKITIANLQSLVKV